MAELTLINGATSVIESATTYFFLSTDHNTEPMLVGDRDRLEKVLKNVKQDMVIATAGNKEKCIVWLDYSLLEIGKMLNDKKHESRNKKIN